MHLPTLSVLALLGAALAAPSARIKPLVRRAGRTSAPAGCLTVGSGGTYSTLAAALTQLGTSSTAAACIWMNQGTYSEQVTINYKGALTLYGYTSEFVTSSRSPPSC